MVFIFIIIVISRRLTFRTAAITGALVQDLVAAPAARPSLAFQITALHAGWQVE
ncbi:MAG TPA: hypothetical protein VF607_02475 [Verrucomicrobiae bacterium]